MAFAYKPDEKPTLIATLAPMAENALAQPPNFSPHYQSPSTRPSRQSAEELLGQAKKVVSEIPEKSKPKPNLQVRLSSFLDQYSDQLEEINFSNAAHQSSINAQLSLIGEPPLPSSTFDWPVSASYFRRRLNSLPTDEQRAAYVVDLTMRAAALEPMLRIGRAEDYLSSPLQTPQTPPSGPHTSIDAGTLTPPILLNDSPQDVRRNIGLWLTGTASASENILHTVVNDEHAPLSDGQQKDLLSIQSRAEELEKRLQAQGSRPLSFDLFNDCRTLRQDFQSLVSQISEDQYWATAGVNIFGVILPPALAEPYKFVLRYNSALQGDLATAVSISGLVFPPGELVGQGMFALMGLNGIAHGVQDGNAGEAILGAAMLVPFAAAEVQKSAEAGSFAFRAAGATSRATGLYFTTSMSLSTYQTLEKARRTYLSFSDVMEAGSNLFMITGFSIASGALKGVKVKKVALENGQKSAGFNWVASDDLFNELSQKPELRKPEAIDSKTTESVSPITKNPFLTNDVAQWKPYQDAVALLNQDYLGKDLYDQFVSYPASPSKMADFWKIEKWSDIKKIMYFGLHPFGSNEIQVRNTIYNPITEETCVHELHHYLATLGLRSTLFSYEAKGVEIPRKNQLVGVGLLDNSGETPYFKMRYRLWFNEGLTQMLTHDLMLKSASKLPGITPVPELPTVMPYYGAVRTMRLFEQKLDAAIQKSGKADAPGARQMINEAYFTSDFSKIRDVMDAAYGKDYFERFSALRSAREGRQYLRNEGEGSATSQRLLNSILRSIEKNPSPQVQQASLNPDIYDALNDFSLVLPLRFPSIPSDLKSAILKRFATTPELTHDFLLNTYSQIANIRFGQDLKTRLRMLKEFKKSTKQAASEPAQMELFSSSPDISVSEFPSLFGGPKVVSNIKDALAPDGLVPEGALAMSIMPLPTSKKAINISKAKKAAMEELTITPVQPRESPTLSPTAADAQILYPLWVRTLHDAKNQIMGSSYMVDLLRHTLQSTPNDPIQTQYTSWRNSADRFLLNLSSYTPDILSKPKEAAELTGQLDRDLADLSSSNRSISAYIRGQSGSSDANLAFLYSKVGMFENAMNEMTSLYGQLKNSYSIMVPPSVAPAGLTAPLAFKSPVFAPASNGRFNSTIENPVPSIAGKSAPDPPIIQRLEQISVKIGDNLNAARAQLLEQAGDAATQTGDYHLALTFYNRALKSDMFVLLFGNPDPEILAKRQQLQSKMSQSNQYVQHLEGTIGPVQISENSLDMPSDVYKQQKGSTKQLSSRRMWKIATAAFSPDYFGPEMADIYAKTKGMPTTPVRYINDLDFNYVQRPDGTLGLSVSKSGGHYHDQTDVVVLSEDHSPFENLETSIHELFHRYSSGGSKTQIFPWLQEGFTEMLAWDLASDVSQRLVLAGDTRFEKPADASNTYTVEVLVSRSVDFILSESLMANNSALTTEQAAAQARQMVKKAYFTNNFKAVGQAIDSKYGAGYWKKISQAESEQDALRVLFSSHGPFSSPEPPAGIVPHLTATELAFLKQVYPAFTMTGRITDFMNSQIRAPPKKKNPKSKGTKKSPRKKPEEPPEIRPSGTLQMATPISLAVDAAKAVHKTIKKAKARKAAKKAARATESESGLNAESDIPTVQPREQPIPSPVQPSTAEQSVSAQASEFAPLGLQVRPVSEGGQLFASVALAEDGEPFTAIAPERLPLLQDQLQNYLATYPSVRASDITTLNSLKGLDADFKEWEALHSGMDLADYLTGLNRIGIPHELFDRLDGIEGAMSDHGLHYDLNPGQLAVHPIGSTTVYSLPTTDGDHSALVKFAQTASDGSDDELFAYQFRTAMGVPTAWVQRVSDRLIVEEKIPGMDAVNFRMLEEVPPERENQPSLLWSDVEPGGRYYARYRQQIGQRAAEDAFLNGYDNAARNYIIDADCHITRIDHEGFGYYQPSGLTEFCAEFGLGYPSFMSPFEPNNAASRARSLFSEDQKPMPDDELAIIETAFKARWDELQSAFERNRPQLLQICQNHSKAPDQNNHAPSEKFYSQSGQAMLDEFGMPGNADIAWQYFSTKINTR